MKEQPDQNNSRDDDLLPSIFGSWKKLYAIVLGTLFSLIILFYLLTIFLA